MKKTKILTYMIFLTLLFSIIEAVLPTNTQIEPISYLDIQSEFQNINQNLGISKGLVSPAELEQFLDEIIADQLDEYNITGATVSVVKDGSVYLEKGYGYKSPYSNNPIIANETLFRIGSISKTFTAIAVLQLVEDGILDLDTDVNEYLTVFKIPETYVEPITLRHILTHTAGFEETIFNIIFTSISELDSLEEILKDEIPDRVHPPGYISAYSNYGLSLAGYIVETMSGIDFESYVEEEILVPLGMNSSTFRQPLPVSLAPNMSGGHYSNGMLGYFEYISLVPAGAMSSTASDMGRFMLAMLNNASIDGNQILENVTVDMMLGDNFISHEKLQGTGLGVYEMDMNGYSIIGHGGDTIFFHSRMFLMPDQDLGFFISYNSRQGNIAKSILFSMFMHVYFPFEGVEVTPLKNHSRRARKFTGFFISTRRTYSNKPNLDEREWLEDGLEITSKKGHIILNVIPGIDFVEVEPLFFRESTGNYDLEIAFHINEKGRITHLTTNFIVAVSAYEKTHILYTQSEIQAIMSIVIITLTFFSLIYWGIRKIVDNFKDKERKTKIHRAARWSVLGNFVLFGIIILFTLLRVYSGIILDFEVNQVFNGLLIFPYLYLLSTISLIVFTGFAWTGVKDMKRKPYWKLSGRIHYTIITLLSIILVGVLVSWHFFG